MNRAAEQHLAKAEVYLGKGEEWYRKAAAEIVAAKEADPALSNKMVGERLGFSATWVSDLIGWRERGHDGARFTRAVDQPVGGRNVRGAKTFLRDAPMEQVERVIDELPAKQVAKLAQASLSKTGIAREIAKSPDASAAITRASGQVREEAEFQNRQRTRTARKEDGSVAAGAEFLVDVIGALLGAKRKLNESYLAARDHEVGENQREAIEEVLNEVVMIVDWYRSYLASGDQSFEQELERLLNP